MIGLSGLGKSFLPATIVDEADVLFGTVSVPRAVANSLYQLEDVHRGVKDWVVSGLVACVTQNPGLENGSLRDNILFGLPLEQERYNMVIDGVDLGPDLTLLADGDRTEVGFRGPNVSGEQCCRIALARGASTLALFEEEFREIGAVKASVLRKDILASGGYIFWLIFSTFIGGSQVAILGRTYWVKVWTES